MSDKIKRIEIIKTLGVGRYELDFSSKVLNSMDLELRNVSFLWNKFKKTVPGEFVWPYMVKDGILIIEAEITQMNPDWAKILRHTQSIYDAERIEEIAKQVTELTNNQSITFEDDNRNCIKGAFRKCKRISGSGFLLEGNTITKVVKKVSLSLRIMELVEQAVNDPVEGVAVIPQGISLFTARTYLSALSQDIKQRWPGMKVTLKPYLSTHAIFVTDEGLQYKIEELCDKFSAFAKSHPEDYESIKKYTFELIEFIKMSKKPAQDLEDLI